MDNPVPTSFGASLALVLDEMRNIKELRQSTRAKQTRFAIDACLVAHGVRTGYLVDAVFPPNPRQIFTALLEALRAKCSVFAHVVWWHHTPTAQSFLVHMPLLHEKLAAVLGGAGECVFIILDKHLSAVTEPPDGFRDALCHVGLLMSESPGALMLSLPDSFAEDILVPLAAVMIDYPVAYSPAASGQTSFLSGELLDVYTVSFKDTAHSCSTPGLGKEHALIKFSCPRALACDRVGLSSRILTERLQAKFTARLGRIGMHTLVTHHAVTLDRVAL